MFKIVMKYLLDPILRGELLVLLTYCYFHSPFSDLSKELKNGFLKADQQSRIRTIPLVNSASTQSGRLGSMRKRSI